MDRKNVWILAVAIVLGFLIFGLTQLSAQRFPGDGRNVESFVGRYQVVRSSPDAVLLLDTVTGELYNATREDIRPSSTRPTLERMPRPDPRKLRVPDDKKPGFKEVPDRDRRFKDKDKGPFFGDEKSK